MRVVVAIEAHFYVVDGLAYSSYLTYDSFWQRYLDVFDSVLIIARATDVDRVPAGCQPVTKGNVELAALPQYHGAYQYIRKMPHIRAIIRRNLRPNDAYILRVAGNIATQVWKHLRAGYPFGVEVMSDPWVMFAPGSIKSIGRPFYRWQWTRNLKKQCRQAVAASYVTHHILQQRYPPDKGADSTHYSSIELSDADICNDVSRRVEAISTIPGRLAGNGPPVRLGFVGTFSQSHKLPHIHIKALAQCAARHANVTLDMIGDGVLLEDTKSLAQKLGVADRVKFHGRLPGGKPIMDCMDTFDLFLNASGAEGLPRVVIEAMSRGCPCIASNVGGTPELLEQSHLVPPGDANVLAETILHVLADPQSMAETVKRNIRIARNYCADKLQPRRQAFYTALRERTEKYLSEKL
jgi:glycosyltransferase involved in cell wall biosynthesis